MGGAGVEEEDAWYSSIFWLSTTGAAARPRGDYPGPVPGSDPACDPVASYCFCLHDQMPQLCLRNCGIQRNMSHSSL